MAIQTFDVTHTSVHDHYFPSLAAFGAGTKPTSTIVGEMVNAESAKLAGALLAVGLSATTINNSSTYPNAHAWCAETIRLGAAIRVMTAIAGAGAVPEAWKEDLAARYKTLSELGYVALGDAPAAADEANGPRSHISEHDLDTGDEDLISDVIPVFRRSDML